MAAKSRNIMIKIDGVRLLGVRSKTITIANEFVDVTNESDEVDGNLWRMGLGGAGDRMVSVTGALIDGGFQVDAGVVLPSLGDLTFPISLECWFNVTQISSIQYLMCTHLYADTYTEKYGFSLQIQTTGAIDAVVWQGSANKLTRTSGGLINTDTTYHLVAVFTSISDVKIYLNAVDKPVSQSGSGTGVDTSLGVGGIGRGPIGTPIMVGSMNGNIDEVAIYNTALTQEQIENHYNIGAGL